MPLLPIGSLRLDCNLTLGRLDCDVVCRHIPLCHDAISIEGPVFIPIGAIPLPSIIMELILEVHRDGVVVEGEQILPQAVPLLHLPFLGEKFDDGISALEEVVSVAPNTVLRVALGNLLWVLCVPVVFGYLHFLSSCLQREGWHQAHISLCGISPASSMLQSERCHCLRYLWE